MLDAHYNLALAHDRLFNADAAHSHYNAYRKLMIAKLKNDGSTGRARVIPEVGAASRVTAAGGTMVNGGAISARGRAASANGAGFKTGGGTPAALTADGASAARRSARARRGRPVPGYAQSAQGTAQAGRGTAQQGLRQPGLARQSTARRAVRSARAAPVAPRQNSQQQSGDKQKWWIQDRLNRTQ